MKSRYLILFAFIALAVIIFVSGTGRNKGGESASPPFITNFLEADALTHASVGISLVEVESSKVLLSYNSHQSLIPASVQKLLIAGAALETLGSDFTFETQLNYDGTIDADGTLRGNLIIKGGGDPTLASPRFKDHYGDVIEDFVRAITKAGIQRIEGKIIGDATCFGQPQIADTWIWEDIGNYYGATASGLNIYENTYALDFSSGGPGTLSKVLKTDPELPFLKFDNQVTASQENTDNAYIYGSYMSKTRIIRGTIPAHRKSFTIKGAIPDPAFLAAWQLSQSLKKSGIPVSGNPESNSESIPGQEVHHLLSIFSPPLSEIIFQLNMKSINLYAESLLLQLAVSNGADPNIDTACAKLESFWKEKGMDTGGLFLEDGSGLSRANGLSADHLTFLLRLMKNESAFADVFIKSLPVSGLPGSLKYFGGKELKGKFMAKSGSMARVMNYAGYLSNKQGHELALVIMINNYTCENTEIRGLIEDLVLEMAEWEGF
jgi:D-alanyl-D-alanine carboxypeptidase/D-alanyl-D-alanine-endopeptidase (penicillin-binding protein 4)